MKWKSESIKAKELDTPTKTLIFVDKVKDYFPNIYVLLVISATLPVSSSTIKLLKTSLRSTMGNERLNGLAMMLIHRDIHVERWLKSFLVVIHAGFY